VADPITRALLALRSSGAGVAVVNQGSPVPYVGKAVAGGASLMLRRDGRDRGNEIDQMSSVGTLYGVIRRLAEATAADRHQWHLHLPSLGQKCELCGEQGAAAVTEHPMLNLWSSPNPFHYGQLFREASQQHIDLTGESFWVVVKLLGVPVELWPVSPACMMPVTSREKYLLGWIYTGPDGEQVPLKHDEVVQPMMPDPSDPYRGLGPLGSLAPDLAGARQAAEWNAQFFKNSAIPGGIIQFDEPMGDTDYEQFVTRWRELHQGVGNAHRVAIIERGKWVDRNFSQRDMEFTSLSTLTGDKIREAFGFPKFAQGIVDDVNRATAEASDDFFAQWLSVPRLDRFKAVLNHRIVPMFGTMAGAAGGRRLTFAYVSPVQGDQESAAKVFLTRAQGVTQLVQAGFDSAEALDAAGLPAMSWTAPPEPKQVSVTGRPQPAALPPTDTATGQRAIEAMIERNFVDAIGWWESELGLTAEVPPEAQRIQDDWTRALDKLERTWTSDVVPDQVEALLDAGQRAIEESHPAMLAALTHIAAFDLTGPTEVLLEAMVDIAERAAGRVVQEAAAAGVKISPVLPADLDTKVFAVASDRLQAAGAFQQVAEAAAALLASGLAQAIGNEMMRWFGSGRSGGEVRDRVAAWMRDNPGTSSLRTRLGGLLTRAQNRARIATLAAAPVTNWYASEVLDGNTCDPCKKINGQRLPTLEAMLLAYGGTGGYLFCLGRERCRGFPVARWENEANDG
jgi:phage portal protein BeeE